MVLEELIELPNKFSLKWLVWKGLKLGSNCYIDKSATIDGTFPWLIKIGDHCTITYNSIILAHDASTKRHLGYSKIGEVSIGNNCFIGSGTIILPNVHIGNNTIIGAGALVNRDIPGDSVAFGNPAKVACSIDEFLDHHRRAISIGPLFPREKLHKGRELNNDNKLKIKASVEGKIGYLD
jgi:maltose O-acetyltransferase